MKQLITYGNTTHGSSQFNYKPTSSQQYQGGGGYNTANFADGFSSTSNSNNGWGQSSGTGKVAAYTSANKNQVLAYGYESTSSPSKGYNLEDLRSDNIYLQGGSNIAEAMSKKNSIEPLSAKYGTNGSAPGLSIAMRMKRNRDALSNNPTYESSSVQAGDNEYFRQGNPFVGTSSRMEKQ